MRIYRRLQFGSLIDLSVLDTRQWRSDQACNDGLRNCPASLDPARTMLGAEQEKWVFDNLADADGALDRAVAAGLLLRARLREGEPRRAVQPWTCGTATRRRGSASIRASRRRKAPNPIVISGDVHVHYGADLKLDFADPKSEVDRHRVHEHVGLGRRRRRRRVGQLGRPARRQPAHPLPQRPPRLHRLHRHAGDDARGFQDPRPRHVPPTRRSAQGDRWSSKRASAEPATPNR